MRSPFDDTGSTEPTLAFALSTEALSLDDLDGVVQRSSSESSIPPPPATEVMLPDADPTELIARAIRDTLASAPDLSSASA